MILGTMYADEAAWRDSEAAFVDAEGRRPPVPPAQANLGVACNGHRRGQGQRRGGKWFRKAAAGTMQWARPTSATCTIGARAWSETI